MSGSVYAMPPRMLFDFVWNPVFLLAMVFGGVANACAFFVLYRMQKLRHPVGVWRTHKDWGTYRDYWRIAPTMKWSRTPLVIAFISFVVAATLLFSVAFGFPRN